MIVAAPVAPLPAPATGIAVPVPATVATPDATANAPVVPRAPETAASAVPQTVDPAAPDVDAPVQLPTVDPRTVKKDGDAAAIAQAAVAPPVDDSAQPASVAHVLRALGLGHRQAAAPDGTATPQPVTGHQRDPNNRRADPLARRGHREDRERTSRIGARSRRSEGPGAVAEGRRGRFDPHRRGFAARQRCASTRRAIPRQRGSTIWRSNTRRASPPNWRIACWCCAANASTPRRCRSSRANSDASTFRFACRPIRTHVAFTAQHAGVRDALEGQMPRLRAMLEEAGLSLGNVDVAHSGSRGAGDSGTARSYSPDRKR